MNGQDVDRMIGRFNGVIDALDRLTATVERLAPAPEPAKDDFVRADMVSLHTGTAPGGPHFGGWHIENGRVVLNQAGILWPTPKPPRTCGECAEWNKGASVNSTLRICRFDNHAKDSQTPACPDFRAREVTP